MSTVLNENAAPQPAVPETPQAPVAPAPETPTPAAEPAIDPKDRRAFIARELKNPTRRGQHAAVQPRSPEGKFAGPPQFPKPGEAQPPAQPAAPAPPAIPRPPMPKSLKAELAAHWEKAPEELAAAIVKREEDYERGVTPLKEKARVADELLNEFKPYEHMLRAENTTPAAAIRSLLQTAAILRTGSPAVKAQHAAQMMRQFGIPLEHVQQVFSGNAPPQPALDPQYQQLAQQVELLKANQQQVSDAYVQSALAAFKANPQHKHFDAVRPQMSAFLAAPESLGVDLEGLSEQELLSAAYDAACYANPAIRQQILAEQQAGERAAAQVAHAKQAAVQVTGAPASGPVAKPDPHDRRAFIANELRRAR